jgi:ATP-dependent RNA helicase DDX3X
MRQNIRLCGYEFPTPIQAYAIPAVLTGHDLIAIAQTGKSPSYFLCLRYEPT